MSLGINTISYSIQVITQDDLANKNDSYYAMARCTVAITRVVPHERESTLVSLHASLLRYFCINVNITSLPLLLCMRRFETLMVEN
jgi:hypothetical protein